MKNLAAIKAKANANYTCQECGSTELIQAHHQIRDNDASLVVLCAECHSKKHPDVPKSLFFNKDSQSYWHNKSAASLAKEMFVHSRTIIRAVRKLGIPPGELSGWDEILIRKNVIIRKRFRPKPIPKPKEIVVFKKVYKYFCLECSLLWVSLKENPKFGPCGHLWNT